MGRRVDEYRAFEEKAVGRPLTDEEWRKHWVSRWNGAYQSAVLADDLDALGASLKASLPPFIRRWFEPKQS